MKTLQEWIEENKIDLKWIKENKLDLKELQEKEWNLEFQIRDAEALIAGYQRQRIALEIASECSENPEIARERKARGLKLQCKEQTDRAIRLRAQRRRITYAVKIARRSVDNATERDFYQTHDPND